VNIACRNKSNFSKFLRQLWRWHCSHLLPSVVLLCSSPADGVRTAVSRKPAARRGCGRIHGTDRRTDARSCYRLWSASYVYIAHTGSCQCTLRDVTTLYPPLLPYVTHRRTSLGPYGCAYAFSFVLSFLSIFLFTSPYAAWTYCNKWWQHNYCMTTVIKLQFK